MIEDNKKPLSDGANDPADARQEFDAPRRELLIKYAKWSSPAMITLLLTDKASAASLLQDRPPPPGF